jgi:hypothetical protein
MKTVYGINFPSQISGRVSSDDDFVAAFFGRAKHFLLRHDKSPLTVLIIHIVNTFLTCKNQYNDSMRRCIILMI